MNTKQTASLNTLVELFAKIRNFTNLVHTEAIQANGQVHVLIVPESGEEFPVISIGKQGGFGMPDIKSYPENGKPSSFEFPGNTALDAVLFGDKHLARQKAGRTKKVAVVAETPTVVETPAPAVLVQAFENSTLSQVTDEEQQLQAEADAEASGQEVAG